MVQSPETTKFPKTGLWIAFTKSKEFQIESQYKIQIFFFVRWPQKKWPECCHPYPILFHYVRESYEHDVYTDHFYGSLPSSFSKKNDDNVDTSVSEVGKNFKMEVSISPTKKYNSPSKNPIIIFEHLTD